MKEKRVWIGLAVLFAVIGVPQLFWKPSRFGGIFLLALAIGCMGEWLMLCGREKHKACRICRAWDAYCLHCSCCRLRRCRYL